MKTDGKAGQITAFASSERAKNFLVQTTKHKSFNANRA